MDGWPDALQRGREDGNQVHRPGIQAEAPADDAGEVEKILDISSRLVVNQAALKLKREPLRALIEAFASALPNRP